MFARSLLSGSRLALLPALLLVGCVDEVATTDEAAGDEAVSESTSDLTDTNQTWPLAWHGGTGGGTAYNLGCTNGEVTVGLFGRAGGYVDQLGFMCARVNADGSLGGEYRKGAFGGGGGYYWESHCPSQQAMVGIYGRSHTYLDQINLVCAPAPFTSYPSYIGGAGGGGGDFWIDNCPHGYAIRSFVMKWGNWMDGISAQCTYYAP